MTLGERISGLDLRALVPAFVVAFAAFLILILFIDRVDRIAKAKPIGSDRTWKAESGNELRLSGLDEGPLFGVETSPGGELLVHAASARLASAGSAQTLDFLLEGNSNSDNKGKVQVSLLGKNGSVRLSRPGEAVVPRLRIQVNDAELKVDTGVTIGDSLMSPSRIIRFGPHQLKSSGMGFSFIVPAGGAMSIEFPAFPGKSASGVVSWLGAVRAEREDTVLRLREAAVFREEAPSPDKSVCAASHEYAWSVFFRLSLFPYPTEADCSSGPMTGRGFLMDQDSVAVSLAGYGWRMEEGKPTASLLSFAKSNLVLSVLINWGIPGAAAWILGLVTLRLKTAASPIEAPKEPLPKKLRSPARRRPKRAP